MDCSPPGSSIHGILQARILEWDSRDPFSSESSRPSDQTQVSCISGRSLTAGATRSHIYVYVYVYVCVYIYMNDSFQLLQNIEYSSLSYAVGPCYLFIYIYIYSSVYVLISSS